MGYLGGWLLGEAVVAQTFPVFVTFGLAVVEIFAVWTVVGTFIALVMLGMFPDWTEPAVRTARNSTLVSFAIGFVGTFILGVLVVLAGIIAIIPIFGWIIAFVVMIPLLLFAVACYAVSIITLGAALSRRLGRNSIWLGVFVGAVAIVALQFVPILGRIVVVVVQTIGFGAGIRVTFGSGTSKQTERSVPPAHRL
mgnify:CR=1 FL=1